MDADKIKQALRDCETVADVDRVATEYRAAVRALATGNADDKLQAIHISNLKAYMLWILK